MKCTIPEISWHNRDPVLSVDIQPLTNEGFYRLASGGTDSHVLIWHIKILETGATTVEPVSDLTRHQRAVNVVRWSNSGQYLASGDDDANIIIWHQKTDDLAVMLDDDNDDKEKWSVFKVLRGHKEDVYDICWSPDSSKLISGSVDNSAIIWDLHKGLNDSILTDHKGFVQGVTWDPLGQYVATLSSDRICRVFNETGKQIKARLQKGQLPVSESHALHGQIVRYFHDDTLKSFFRRLTFSPDGSLIIAPAGCLEVGPDNKNLYTSYIYSITSLTQPAAIIPSPSQYTVAARCCPILFQLHPDGPDPVISLPYRIVFAIATRSSVILYDTQQMTPFGTISNIHYTRLTDVTWSHNGRLLAVSSTDGFCSLVTFEPEELGVEYVKEPEVLEEDANETVEEIMETVNISLDDKKDDVKEKKPSFLQMWTKKANVEEKSPGKRKSEEDDDVTVKRTKSDKPATLIAVRRKPKESESKSESDTTRSENTVEEKSTEYAQNKNKIQGDKPATPIAVRRKPKISAKNIEKSTPQEFIPNESDKQEKNQVEKLATPIAKKIKDEKPTTPIAARRKSRDSKNENDEENVIIKKCEVKDEANKMEVETDDVIVIENEKENIVENVLKSQNENISPKKDLKNTTPDSKKRVVKSSSKKLQATPARKTPGGQLNITQFLKSCPTNTTLKSKQTQKSDMSPRVLLEDYKTTGKTYEKNDDKDKVILIDDDESFCEIIVAPVINCDDDSQNIKLVLEDTQDELGLIENPAEKLKVDDSFVIHSKLNKRKHSTEKLIEINEKLNLESEVENKDNIISNESISSNKTNDSVCIEKINGLVNCNKEDGKEIRTENEELIQENSNLSEVKTDKNKIRKENTTDSDIKTENCDTKSIPDGLTKIDVQEDKLTPLSSILSLPKDSPAKKRVPLITLSSPKHKKKAL